ncbi:MAG: PIN domain-containing protein [Solirubrobacteraceae bacterium]
MAPAARGLLDTSVFIAAESARDLEHALLPDENVVCPVTIAELQVGVLAAADLEMRARRLATLESIADVEVLAIDAAVAAEWARLRVHLAQTRRRININDLWIAATAAANALPVVTQDDDFGALGGVAGVDVIRV